MKKTIFLVIVLLFSQEAFARANISQYLTLLKHSTSNSTDFLKLKYINISYLNYDSKGNNIRAILNIAAKEGRISSSISDQIRIQRLFSNITNGDEALLACMKAPICSPENFTSEFSRCFSNPNCADNFRRVANTSSLHNQVAVMNPFISYGSSHAYVGRINENLMTRFFESSGWRRIEGEVGRQGIDGLFIKRNRSGSIIDVMIVEAKVNTSPLGNTLTGQQMSKDWLINNIFRLIIKNPQNNDYSSILRHISNDNYRSRLWHMTANGNELNINLQRINSNRNNVDVIPLRGGEKMLVNYDGNNIVDLINPKNGFHNKVSAWYAESLRLM